MYSNIEPTIWNMDVLTFLEDCPKYKVMFADPPDNLGLEYDGFRDRVPAAQYYGWVESWILRAMLKCDILWVSYYYKHDLQISRIVSRILETRHPSWGWQKILWRFTFGQYNDGGFTNGHRPILMLTAPQALLHWDKIRVPSDRMLMGDSRASGPRTPDDVWEIPRVVGNAKERRSWHPTQHPEELLRKVMLLSGNPFVDLFGGTGTSMRVGKRLGFNVSCVEQSSQYCAHISAENGVRIARSVRSS